MSERINNLNPKYTFDEIRKSFALTMSENPKDLFACKIGDEKDVSKVFAQMKIERWDNENNVSIRLKNFDNYSVKTEKEKIKLVGDKIEAHFYKQEKTEDLPEGMEFEILLKEKPATNLIEFSLVDKDVSYFYQPSLKKEKLEEGQTATDTDIFDKDGNVICHRPVNIVGSYAVYSKSSKTNYTGGKEYKCGKIGHIYRPKIIDSAGTEVWGKLNITDNLLTVTIPQEFLDNAVYPVRHAAGLTFGQTSSGETDASGSNDFMLAVLGTPASGGTLESISVYIVNGVCDDGPYKGFIYDNNLALVAQTAEVTSPATGQFVTTNFTTTPTITVQQYSFGVWGEEFSLRYDATSPPYGGRESSHNYPGTLPDPWSGYGDPPYCYSIYCTYTAGGAAGTNMKINISDTWKDVDKLEININDVWKDVTKVQLNVGDSWKTIFEP